MNDDETEVDEFEGETIEQAAFEPIPDDPKLNLLRRCVRAELQNVVVPWLTKVSADLDELRAPSRTIASQTVTPAEVAPSGVARPSAELVTRVLHVFNNAAKPDQGQAVTFLVRVLGATADDIRIALHALVAENKIWVRKHMKGHLYYLAGRGPKGGVK